MNNLKLMAVLWLSLMFELSPVTASEAASSPDLVIVISVDQLGADLFNQYRGRFRNGFKTLSAGIVYPNAYHSHGVTETCAGHAVISSGYHPNRTGIVSNDWYDGEHGKTRYCIDDDRNNAAQMPKKSGAGPGLLEVFTLGDWAKSAVPDTRVFSVAGKDRSAIMLGGHNPDGAYWYDSRTQTFDTWGASKNEAQDRLKVLSDFNNRLSTRLSAGHPEWTYHDAQCRSLEHEVTSSSGRAFLAKVPPDVLAQKPGVKVPAVSLPAWFVDQVTLEAALDIIASQRLGRRGVTDILSVGLAGTDMIGHAYGSQGPEMCDHLARLDTYLGEFLRGIEALGVRVAIALTADHGASDFAERMEQRGYDRARRVPQPELLGPLNDIISSRVGIDWAPLRAPFVDPGQLSIVDRDGYALEDANLRLSIIDTAVKFLESVPYVVGAWTAEALQAHRIDPHLTSDLYSLEDRMSLSAFPGRSADILVAFDPHVTMAHAYHGVFMVGHSSPYDFNRRVPILFYGQGLLPQERAMPVNVVDLAPTLSRLMGLVPPEDVDGRCLELGTSTKICDFVE